MVFSNDSLITHFPTYKTFLFDNDFQSFFPEIFLIGAAIFLLVYGVIFSTSPNKNYPLLIIPVSWLSLLACVFALLLLLNSPIQNALLFYNTLLIDDFTTFLKALILFSSFFCIFMSLDSFKLESLNAFECILLLLFSACSMLFLVSSADFISMYLAIELQSLSFYVLAAIKRNSEFSTEAGLKYFLLGAFSSGLLLFGCSLIYGFTGVTNFSELAQIFTGGTQEILTTTTSLPACELGMVFLLVGFLFKITAVPFHMWSPDVYEGAPTPITAFFVIVPKAALFGVFLRIFLESFYDFLLPWQKILLVSSLCSMLLGSLAALSQTRIKRLLAYSSIGHVGYLLAGFACGTIEGIQALLIYLFIYICMNINIFALLLCGMRRETLQTVPRIKFISDFSFLSKTQPILALTFTITLFSMAGIPPLAGFYSKAYLFFATMSSNLYVLAIVGVVCSVVSCFYYIRLVKIMYFEGPKNWCSFSRIPVENALTLAITLFFILFFIFYPTPLHLITHKIALTLCL
uniref:NADH dehydrogenase subunit 2 n=1 Tax=Chlorella vulgaris TaxID=3077 RepID=A0A650ANZ3_CHLVU|nr:NADH dehydrogenase subunit 2 [Chlorella vulgaris]QGN75025.1 NADH dehydrogenase subunit 2 [Chlorella vulgaris]